MTVANTFIWISHNYLLPAFIGFMIGFGLMSLIMYHNGWRPKDHPFLPKKYFPELYKEMQEKGMVR